MKTADKDAMPTLPQTDMSAAETARAGGEDVLQDLHNELYRAQITDSPDVLTDAVGKARLILSRYRAALSAPPAVPIEIVLHCPKCGLQHIDKPEGQFYPGHTAEESVAANKAYGLWDNPPHRSHLCHGCGHIWRPADVPTNGVRAVRTTGKADSPIAALSQPATTEAGDGVARGEVPIAPDTCSITGRKFWGNWEHPERGVVALYGGPFDSFTIPELSDDGELRCERYDQDAGEWVEGGEPVGWFSKEQPNLSPPVAAVAQPVADERAAFDKIHLTVEGAPSFRTWSKWNEVEKAAAWEAWQRRAALPAPPAVLVTDDTWPAYVAGIIETYIKQDRTDEDRETGIAKIIERRMWAIAKPKAAEGEQSAALRAQAAPTAAWKFNALYADTEVRRVADDKLLAVIHPSSERLSIVNLLKGAATSHAIAPATQPLPRFDELLGVVRTAMAQAERVIKGDEAPGDLARTRADLPLTLQVIEHALATAALQSVKPKDTP